MKNEIWKDIEGYEGYYQVSNYGRVKSLERISIQNHLIKERILKIYKDVNGYMMADLYIDGKRKHHRVHRLVSDAFVPNPRKLNEIDHIDTIKSNNNYENLRWCTHSENHLNELTVELKRRNNLGKKLSKETVKKLRKKVGVFKENELIHIFSSYLDLDNKSEDIIGEKLWSIYARHVVQGKRLDYKGYTFKIIN